MGCVIKFALIVLLNPSTNAQLSENEDGCRGGNAGDSGNLPDTWKSNWSKAAGGDKTV